MSHNRDRKTNLYKEVVVAGETGKVPKTQGGRERGGKKKKEESRRKTASDVLQFLIDDA